MKNLLVLLFLFLFTNASILAQWGGSTGTTGNIYRDGSVGIGNSSPTEKLDVTGTIKANEGLFYNPVSDGATFFNSYQRNTLCKVIGAGSFQGSGTYDHMFNVYDFPQSNIDAKSMIWVSAADRDNNSRWRFYAETNGSTNLKYYNKSQVEIFSLIEDNNFVQMRLNQPNSVLTIGTYDYDDGTDIYRLSVNGKVRANSVKVYTDWADFVFEKDYALPSLDEVAAYIEKNGHLKDIPSALEVEKKGIDLGEMNKLLLQKIEELTLYLLVKDKEVKELQDAVKELQQIKK